MLESFALYRRFLGISVRAQMAYRASFLMQTVGNLAITGCEFLAIWSLFERFGAIRGWALPEAAMLYGLVNLSYAVAEALSYGFDAFGGTVKRGEFDRLLLRPRSPILQLMGQHVALKNIGRLLQGAAVLGWAAANVSVAWTPGRVALLGLAWAGGVCLFFGLMVLQATLAFWTTESLEVMNAFTYGGVETAQFPLSIYPAWMRIFFLFVIPLGCVTYVPVATVLGKELPWKITEAVGICAPLAAFAFLALAFLIFMIGVRHYTSTGN